MSLRCTLIGVGISSFLSIVQFIVENAGNVWKTVGKKWKSTCAYGGLCAFPGDSHRTCISSSVQNPVPGTRKEVSVNRRAVIF
jgi:hypothetical protein